MQRIHSELMKAAIVSDSTENVPFTSAIENEVSLFVQAQRLLTIIKELNSALKIRKSLKEAKGHSLGAG